MSVVIWYVQKTEIGSYVFQKVMREIDILIIQILWLKNGNGKKGT